VKYRVAVPARIIVWVDIPGPAKADAEVLRVAFEMVNGATDLTAWGCIEPAGDTFPEGSDPCIYMVGRDEVAEKWPLAEASIEDMEEDSEG
jgi:hypothetical protein